MEKNLVIADLHLHSKYARATSKDISLSNLSKYARIKGVNLLGTGDFQHPIWFRELEKLEESDGILYYDGFPFVWQTELSLMYTKLGKGRRIHYVVLAPGKEVVKQIISFLSSKGRLDYDGRPIFGFSSLELLEEMNRINEKIEVIPAHCMTPWFGFFGSKSGYDDLKDAFEDKVNKIHAIESGMSADPEMLWRIDTKKNIISFSDMHSFWPWRIGRESTIFNVQNENLSYDLILKQIRENSFFGTIETEPAYGRYHWDGHRNCNFSCSSEKTKELNKLCPVCGKELTIGVEYRIEELAKHPKGFKIQNPKPYFKLLPLHELIAMLYSSSLSSKKTWIIYNDLIKYFSDEFNILLNVSKEELLRKDVNSKLVELILQNREGKIKIKPGFDGEYGKAILSEKQATLI